MTAASWPWTTRSSLRDLPGASPAASPGALPGAAPDTTPYLPFQTVDFGMIHVRLPNGATRALAPSSGAADLAAAIGPSLVKRTVTALVD
ncbi:MAG: hypothetical protein AAFU49_15010 [Pseudomonadota bacterium]